MGQGKRMGGNEIEERALRFDCEGACLQGVIAAPALARRLGILIVVGGPQYRAGSHRQFVLLARRLAAEGWPAMRFDVRGMGDSSGEVVDFESSGADIAAAVEAFRANQPGLQRVVIWGLCDAASAALLSAVKSPAVAGMVLLNPWVRHEATLQRTQLKHYYGSRLFSRAFWHKLLSGQFAWRASITEFSGKLFRVVRGRLFGSGNGAAAESGDFRERMVDGLATFRGPVLCILSGRDHVAAEFLDYSGSHPRLADLWARPGVARHDASKADHTFSSRQHRAEVEDATLAWLTARFPAEAR